MQKKVITESDIDALVKDGVVEVVRGMIVTPLAREYASRKGIRLVYSGGSVPSAEDIPRDPQSGRKGPPEELLRRAVTEEVARLLSEIPEPRNVSIPPYSPLATEVASTAIAEAAAKEPARCVVVATGINRPGIAAALSTAISDCGGDIQDISQTLVSEFFSMIFVVSLDNLTSGFTFREFKERVEAAGRSIGCECVVFHEAILKAMHRV